MNRLINCVCFTILALALWSSTVSAAVIYAVAGDEFGVGPTTLYSIDPDAQTISILEQFNPITSGLGLMGSVGVGSNSDELFVGFATSPTTSILRSYSISQGSFAVVGSGETAPIVALGGTYYGAGGNGFIGSETDLFSIDPNTGVTTLVGTSPLGYGGDIALDPITGVLYAATAGAGLATVNPTDASMVSLGPFPTFMVGLAFSSDGRLWGLSPGSQLFEVDPSDGSSTFVMSVLGSSFDLASTPIPEPSTALLVGLGFAILGSRRDRRRVKA